MEKKYMCWEMDEREIEDIARRAMLAWENGKSVTLLLEFAKMAREAHDNELVWFREHLWLHKQQVQERLWEIVERELGLSSLEDDIRGVESEAKQVLQARQGPTKERWG